MKWQGEFNRTARKGFHVKLPDDIGDTHALSFMTSMTGKLSHMRSHRTRTPTNYKMAISTENACHFGGKFCKSAGKTKWHKNTPHDKKMNVFYVW